MKRRSLFGAHLYNQIVYPLLAASVIVGIVATVVAVYFLEDLTDRWVSEVVTAGVESFAEGYHNHAEQLMRETRLAADDRDLACAAAAGDTTVTAGLLADQAAVLGVDGIVLMDATGTPVASTGRLGLGPSPDARATIKSAGGSSRSRVAVWDVGQEHAIAALQPVKVKGRIHTLAVIEAVDDRFMRRLGITDGTAYGVYSAGGHNLSAAVGNGYDKVTSARILAAMRRPAPEVLGLIDETTPYESAEGSIRIDGESYGIAATQVNLPGVVEAGSQFYVVGLRDRGLSDETGRTTRNLIAMWSVVAVAALVGLGGWIARRVADPLVELSDGARRIADGDFSTKVDVAGTNEVAELAGSFNDMTDSLRERSESLTKKVLELATLYEMSRALGSTLEMDELLGSVLESALRIFDLDLGYVTLRDKETNLLSVRAVRGAEAAADGALRSSMSEWVVREGRPLIFNPDSGDEGQVDAVTGAKAALCVPLVSAEGTIGSAAIGSSRADYRFSSDDVRLLSTIANHVTIAIGNIELFSSLQEAYLATVRSLAAAVDAKDTYTRDHSDRVATYATHIAEHMGLSHDQRIALEMAAYLHDIGKIGVREEILLKPGLLDDDEMCEMRHHPLIGANILKPVAFPWAITPVVRHHHEAFDGTGYPAGLRGEEIPLLARILTVADSFEAMTADRPYRAGRSVPAATEELRRCSGSQFDPRIVLAFEQVLQEIEGTEDAPPIASDEEIAPEEARAIFAALLDGVLVSFRRLGGPRLASNVEREADAYFESAGMPFRVLRGRVSFTVSEVGSLDEELPVMRLALKHTNAAMSRVSGSTLVEHFYEEAFDGLSVRMRHLAEALRLLDDA
ncbi:MAG: HD domain-containing protein [Coriobacteriia bacterium]|nr:HD domain-containing protein [Coriobacteriia bacterium]